MQTWLITTHLCNSSGIFFLESIVWCLAKAHINLFTNACPTRYGFWAPALCLGFYSYTLSLHNLPIFYHEVFAVVAALHWACQHSLPRHHRIVIHTNNTNMVDIFQLMRVHGPHNALLKLAMDLLIQYKIDSCVVHVCGLDNGVTDALSCHCLSVLTRDQPQLTVTLLQPPPELVRAAPP